MTLNRLSTLALAASLFAAFAGAQSTTPQYTTPQTPQTAAPDAPTGGSSKDQRDALKRQEKASKEQAKSDKAQRKALSQEEKAQKAAAKADH